MNNIQVKIQTTRAEIRGARKKSWVNAWGETKRELRRSVKGFMGRPAVRAHI